MTLELSVTKASRAYENFILAHSNYLKKGRDQKSRDQEGSYKEAVSKHVASVLKACDEIIQNNDGAYSAPVGCLSYHGEKSSTEWALLYLKEIVGVSASSAKASSPLAAYNTDAGLRILDIIKKVDQATLDSKAVKFPVIIIGQNVVNCLLNTVVEALGAIAYGCHDTAVRKQTRDMLKEIAPKENFEAMATSEWDKLPIIKLMNSDPSISQSAENYLERSGLGRERFSAEEVRPIAAVGRHAKPPAGNSKALIPAM